jgi:hypothetical protein
MISSVTNSTISTNTANTAAKSTQTIIGNNGESKQNGSHKESKPIIDSKLRTLHNYGSSGADSASDTTPEGSARYGEMKNDEEMDVNFRLQVRQAQLQTQVGLALLASTTSTTASGTASQLQLLSTLERTTSSNSEDSIVDIDLNGSPTTKLKKGRKLTQDGVNVAPLAQSTSPLWNRRKKPLTPLVELKL